MASTSDYKTTENECEVCGKCIKIQNMNKHIETHDRDRDKSIKCLLCSSVFYEKGSLKVHIQNMHDENLKMFACEKCQRV